MRTNLISINSPPVKVSKCVLVHDAVEGTWKCFGCHGQTTSLPSVATSKSTGITPPNMPTTTPSALSTEPQMASTPCGQPPLISFEWESAIDKTIKVSPTFAPTSPPSLSLSYRLSNLITAHGSHNNSKCVTNFRTNNC